MKKYSLYCITLALISAATFTACIKTAIEPENTNTVTTCNFSPQWNKVAVCKGYRTHPTLGTTFFNPRWRIFKVSGPNSFDSYFSDSAGNILSPAGAVVPRFTFDNGTYYLSTAGSPGNTVVYDPQPQAANRFDSCTGILYLKYSWSNYTRVECDTCRFL